MRARRRRRIAALAWAAANRARRHRVLALIALRGARWYMRRRRVAVQLAFGAAVAVAGMIAGWRASRRPPPLPGDVERRQLRAGSP